MESTTKTVPLFPSRLILTGLALLSLATPVLGYRWRQTSIREQSPHQYITRESDGLYPAIQKNMLGLIDSTGRYVIPPLHDDASYFYEGRVRLMRDGKFGFADSLGHLVVPLQYDTAGDFSEGLAMVGLNGKSGYINLAGKVVIPLQYEAADDFNESLAKVRIRGKWGYIDHTGRVAIEARYAGAEAFDHGVAVVNTGNWQRGLIDRTGKMLLNDRYTNLANLGICTALMLSDTLGLRYQLYSNLARRLLDYTLAEYPRVGDGFACVRIDGKSGFIDSLGALVVKPTFDGAYPFDGNRAPVNVGGAESTFQGRFVGGKWGCVDRAGRLVVEPQYKAPVYFYDGLAPVELNGRQSYIDTLGKTVLCLDTSIRWAGIFEEDLARVRVGGSRDAKGKLVGGKVGFIDRTGRIVIEARYDHVNSFAGSLAVVEVAGKYGYIDRTGNVIVALTLKDANNFNGNLAQITNDQGTAYINRAGRIVWQGSE